MAFYEKLNHLCIKNGTSVTAVAIALGYSRSVVTTWKNSSGMPRSKTVKKIADYFEIPIEYFYETDIDVTIHNNNGVVGDTHAPVTINNGIPSDARLGDIERELLSICSQLDMKRKNALLAKAYELQEK
jgi:transcriptional regulator with XRE-family HTH domain